jgi:hypothetical protein
MNKRAPLLLFLICAALFAFGLVQLFKVRFETGDIYPAYSSLRADPLGVMALYESLTAIPGLEVTRDFTSENRLPEGKATTYLHLGATTSQWRWLPEEAIKEIEAFALNGGRLAITFYPEQRKPIQFSPEHVEESRDESGNPESDKKTSRADKDANNRKLSEKQKRELRRISIKERWGLEFTYTKLPGNAKQPSSSCTVTKEADLALPEELEWHSAIVLTNLPASWRTIYSRDGQPVVIERRFGSGTIAIATDSYFLSNEALRKARHPELLSWLLGPSRHVVFDEAHFGIVESSGVSTLLRKYRLHGLALALLMLAVLFIWKNSVSFVPPYAAETSETYVAGKESVAGFVNLLRRNISSRDVLNVCFEEWKKSFPGKTTASHDKSNQAAALLAAENARGPLEREPVKAYHEISRILHKPQL